jgi:hypothetical protein
MRAGRCTSEAETVPADLQAAWSDDDAFPETRRDFDDVTGMVSVAKKPVFRRKP